MKNNRGFTLVEVLLAAMIVGLIGVALSALTTAAIRESNVGRTRMILRNQLSLAMRQLRQDIHQSTGSAVAGGKLTLYQEATLGPTHQVGTIEYQYHSIDDEHGYITRLANGHTETWLPFVKNTSGSAAKDDFTNANFESPRFRIIQGASNFMDEGYKASSILQVQMILEINTNPVVSDGVDETFILPQGFSIRYWQS